MSLYLFFRKNGVLLCSFSRNSKVFEVFHSYLPYEEDWTEFCVHFFDNVILDLISDRDKTEKQIKRYESGFNARLDYDGLMGLMENLDCLHENLEEIVQAKYYAECLNMIYTETDYDGDTEIPTKLEYCYG